VTANSHQIIKILKRITIPLLLIILVGAGLAYDRSLATPHLSLSNIPNLSLQGSHSLLVVAPHPDDETLGPGGLIQAALANGMSVHVVVVTNGDGQELAPAAAGMGVLPTTADFVLMGERRQQESIAALQKLGVNPSDIVYLSYPDRGIKPIWMADWNTQCPYYSSYTKSHSSPYPITYDPNATYCGWDILHDLQAIIRETKADLIVLPHPDDQHPDHLAVSNFTRMASALESLSDPTYHPTLLGYLVHYGYFPEPRGLHPIRSLLPPVPLSNTDYAWEKYSLTPQQELTKIAAINSYASQVKMMRSFLVSFDRVDEPFMQLSIIALSVQSTGSLPAPVLTGGGINFYEPSRETSRLLVDPGADIVGWQIERQGDTLSLTVKLKGNLLDGTQYITYIKTPDGSTYKYTLPTQSQSLASNSFTTQVSLSGLGNPALISFSAQTRQDVVLDNSAWEFVLLNYQDQSIPTPTP
jgi:LmbE family N-acetylglucosaminyl deacetylase